MVKQTNRKKGETKSIILNAAAKLFLEKGYQNITIAELAKEANVAYGELFRIGIDKENIISELVAYVLEGQFELTAKLLKDKTEDKVLFYAAETVLQLHMAESSEHIRDLYTTAYSLRHSLEKIYTTITKKLEDIFKEYLPKHNTSDFYELEIASAGIMRNFLTVPCNMYFTMDRKISRFLETTLKIYDIPKEKIKEIDTFVSQFDFEKIAQEMIQHTLENLDSKMM